MVFQTQRNQLYSLSAIWEILFNFNTGNEFSWKTLRLWRKSERLSGIQQNSNIALCISVVLFPISQDAFFFWTNFFEEEKSFLSLLKIATV